MFPHASIAPLVSHDVSAAYKGKRVLVTGAFGFVGSHLCRRLVGYHAEVVAVDVDTAASRPSLLNCPEVRDRVRVVTVDVTEEACVRELITGDRFGVIFHLAACAVVEKAAQSPLKAIQTNTMGLVYIVEAVRESVRGKSGEPPTVVLSSTDKVYGEMADDVCDEATPLHGVGVYDAAKLAADTFAQTYSAAYGCQTVVLRLCNLFGPGDFNTCYRVIPRSLYRMFVRPEPEPPILYFDAIEHRRDYLYIDDAIDALLAVGAEPRCRGEVFNVAAARCCSTPTLVREIVDCAARLEEERSSSRADAIRQNGFVLQDHDRQVLTIKKQHLNGGKIQAATGFAPAVTFEDGLRRTVTYYRDYFSSRW